MHVVGVFKQCCRTVLQVTCRTVVRYFELSCWKVVGTSYDSDDSVRCIRRGWSMDQPRTTSKWPMQTLGNVSLTWALSLVLPTSMMSFPSTSRRTLTTMGHLGFCTLMPCRSLGSCTSLIGLFGNQFKCCLFTQSGNLPQRSFCRPCTARNSGNIWPTRLAHWRTLTKL